MFIGHYAIAIGNASFTKEKGALTLIALSSALPDILMLSLNRVGVSLNFHADLGLLACVLIVMLCRALLRVSRKVFLLAILAMVLHLPLDLPYISHDSSNWYAHPAWDFTLEVSLLVLCGGFYLHRQRLSKPASMAFVTMCAGIVGLQAVWNFVVGF
ncbi:hypothetical protein AZI86_16575 [Bdellovibrio bacteriovorus]|uniref:Uncharacterized protein n=1 Tax=Bdellovibrio bacteriovorus TaxID=959 RepID=A0A150WH76_BDEBC|nr:hypothetical protein [Bdellovibrio bacteriovorus]KYG62447.1 hypothetical protein AZI86_16575 [Bdellovibrio bacteriovorus]